MKQRLATPYDEGNRLAAAVILSDVPRYGRGSLLGTWAQLIMNRTGEAGPGDAEIFQLWLACHTQEEIEAAVGITHGAISKVLFRNEDFCFGTKSGEMRELEDEAERPMQSARATERKMA